MATKAVSIFAHQSLSLSSPTKQPLSLTIMIFTHLIFISFSFWCLFSFNPYFISLSSLIIFFTVSLTFQPCSHCLWPSWFSYLTLYSFYHSICVFIHLQPLPHPQPLSTTKTAIVHDVEEFYDNDTAERPYHWYAWWWYWCQWLWAWIFMKQFPINCKIFAKATFFQKFSLKMSRMKNAWDITFNMNTLPLQINKFFVKWPS